MSATVAPIGVQFCMVVYIGPRQINLPFEPEGGIPEKSQNPTFGPLKAEYLRNGKLKPQC